MITPRPYRKLLFRILSASLLGLMPGTAVTQDLIADTVDAYSQPLTADQLREDIGFVFTTIEQVHPHPYHSVAREVILQRKTAQLQTASTPQTLAEFYRDIAAFVNTYDDGHTWIVRPPGVPSLKPPIHHPYPWKFSVLPDGIGYLDFVRMDSHYRPRWREFLQQTFAAIHAQKLTGLIIDLRANSGGDSQLGDDLLAYLTDKPYRPIASKAWRFSAPYVAQMNPVDPWGFALAEVDITQEPPPDIKALLAQRPPRALRIALHERAPSQTRHILERHAPHWLETDGTVGEERETLTISGSRIVPPAEMPLRFRGPVVFLIGPDTFSSAVILANVVEDFQLASLIGEETKPCNQFGEPCFVDLPHSRLRLGIATAQFVRANGDASSRRGVIPSIPVSPSHRDSDLSRDGVVLRAQDYFRQSQIRP
jgi:hypothetical protein